MRTLVKRWWFWVFTILLLTGGALPVYLYLWLPNVQATSENFEKIRKGMTQPQVEVILGGPPGDYTNGPWLADLREAWDETHTRRIWVSDRGRIAVFFDKQGRVNSATFIELHVNELPLLKRIQYKLEKLRAHEESEGEPGSRRRSTGTYVNTRRST